EPAAIHFTVGAFLLDHMAVAVASDESDDDIWRRRIFRPKQAQFGPQRLDSTLFAHRFSSLLLVSLSCVTASSISASCRSKSWLLVAFNRISNPRAAAAYLVEAPGTDASSETRRSVLANVTPARRKTLIV